MLKKIDFIALASGNVSFDYYHAYYIDRRDKNLIYFEIKKHHAIHFTDHPKAIPERPDIYNTFKRTCNAFGLQIKDVIIYGYRGGVFYTYINLLREGKIYNINSDIADGLILSKIYNCNVFIKDDVLEKEGIKINDKIIKDALKGYLYL